MILLSAIIATFEADYLAQAGEAILPSQLNALHALKTCRTSASPLMRAQCTACDHTE
ncbi:transposase zinc-binding domain-containing protein, partial [Thiocystis minor]|uniref:transposase zinc-binding domain-containing protein n=1 Tax=Thiocystis minor TaxID=61597 RepID=UPI001912E60A